MKNKKKTENNLLIYSTFLCAFIMPTTLLIDISNINIANYFFLSVVLFLYIASIIKTKKVTITELILLVIIITLAIIKRQIEPFYLIEYMAAYKYVQNYKDHNLKKICILSLVAVLTYSLIYFGYDGRYIYTGLKEVNQSSFAILLLFLIIRKYNKKIGSILLALGLLSLSRNYALALAAVILCECIKNTKFYDKACKIMTFKNLSIISVAIIIVLSIIFTNSYKNGNLSEYQDGIKRYSTAMDYSNYFRFTTNTKLLEIYKNKPKYLLTGISEDEFYEESLRISQSSNTPYRRIKPHNYFFSYLRIYGIWSIIIFVMLNKIFKKICNKNNAFILIAIIVYASFLGTGLANYWLFLSIITLMIYRDGDNNKNGRRNYNN